MRDMNSDREGSWTPALEKTRGVATGVCNRMAGVEITRQQVSWKSQPLGRRYARNAKGLLALAVANRV